MLALAAPAHSFSGQAATDDLAARAAHIAADIVVQIAPVRLRIVVARGAQTTDLYIFDTEPAADSINFATDTVEMQLPISFAGSDTGWIDAVVFAGAADEAHELLTSAAAQLAPHIAAHEMLRRTQEQGTLLQVLGETQQLFTELHDTDRLLATLHRAVCTLLPGPDFYVAFYDDASALFTLVFAASNMRQLTTGDTWRADQGLAGEVLRSRTVMYTDDYFGECALRGVAPQMLSSFQPGGAWLGIPLIARDRVFGVMTIARRTPGDSITVEQIDVLRLIARQAAQAIDNARLYQHNAQQSHRLAALNRMGRIITSSLDPDRVPAIIMAQAIELLEAEEGSLLLVDERGDLIFTYTIGQYSERLLGRRVPRGMGIAGHVASSGTSVLVNDARNDPRFDPTVDSYSGYVTRGLLAAPLRGVGGVQGVVEVVNRRDKQPFTDGDRQLLEAIGDYAAIAFENARRFTQADQALTRRAQELARTNDRLEHNLRSLTALNALGIALNTSIASSETIFALTAASVAELTNAHGVAIVLNGRRLRIANSAGMAVRAEDLPATAIRRAMRSGRVDALTDQLAAPLTERGIGSLLLVPLRATRATIGCLVALYADALPDESAREMAVLFCTQAAGAVARAELLGEVRAANDRMTSILESTHEAMVLITADGVVALANAAFATFSRLDAGEIGGAAVARLLERWEQIAPYDRAAWQDLRQSLDAVRNGHQAAQGELTGSDDRTPSFAWSVLAVNANQDRSSAVLLVIRDVSEAKASERIRNDLTHMIVHDLRSPLSNVMASVDLLIKGMTGELNDEQRAILTIAGTGAAQMLTMINMLLDISRLEAGRMPIERSLAEPHELIAQASQQLAAVAQERRITIQIDLDANLPQLLLDEALIARVVQNLLANAIKFSGRGTRVSVRATVDVTFAQREAEQPVPCLLVSIIDRGVGIATRDLDRLFTKFSQIGDRRGGSGLGLNFCKLVVEAHGGHMRVESIPGAGSTFTFVLPIITPTG